MSYFVSVRIPASSGRLQISGRFMLRVSFATAALLALVSTALAQEFPQTFEHKFGTTVLEQKPERIVTLTYSGVDHYLALGVVPVGIQFWYGDYPYGVWPWAQDELGGADLVALSEVNYEQIAALEPDVIEAVVSGITEEQYRELSKIAPVVATAADQSDWSMPWYEITRTVGRVTGEQDKAESVVATLQDRIAGIVADHPEWQGMTASVVHTDGSELGVFRGLDARSQVISQLGFTITPALNDLGTPEDFYATASLEQLPIIEADLVVWISGTNDSAPIQALPLRERAKFYQEGREMFAGTMLADAFSWSSPLSFDFLLDEMVPNIEAAVDGDPQTKVPTAEAVGLAP
jgi:iron complex transport system substrate-binding protein